MDELLVSVVIPAFNAATWITEAIESVQRQSYNNLEIIVIDDGSTDNTLEVAEAALKEWHAPYRIIRQENKGVSAARNAGWRAAHGPWIQFLDTDDVLASRKIELQMRTAREQAEADVIYSDWQRLVFDHGAWRPDDKVRHPLLGANALADILLDQNFQQLGSQLFKAQILEKVGGFSESYSLVEDVELCLKIAMVDGVFARAQTSGPVFLYRDRPGSLSKSDQRQFVEACVRNAKLVEHHMLVNRNDEPRTVDAIVDVYFGAARYFADHDWRRFKEILSDIYSLRPEFVPRAPARLRLVSGLFGYRRAEEIAVWFRRTKRAVLSCTRPGSLNE